MSDLRKFEKRNDSSYNLPVYGLGEDGLDLLLYKHTEIDFVSGKLNQQGIVTEGLLSALIDHLDSINVGVMRNRETSTAITKLQEALFWIEERKRDREKRGVSGTKEK